MKWAAAMALVAVGWPSSSTTTVCHGWGIDCHQVRVVQGKSYVRERRHAPTLLGPWSRWKVVAPPR